MTKILTELSDSTLAEATKTSLYAYFSALRYSASTTFREGDHGFHWLTGLPFAWFNGVFSTQDPSDDAAQMIDDALTFFRSQEVTTFSWWLAPRVRSAAWAQYLLPRGFRYDESTPGMAVHLDALPPLPEHALVIQEVTDRQMLAEYARVLVRGFGMPQELAPQFLDLYDTLETGVPAHHYLGYLNDVPVVTSTLLLAAGVAGIYNVATVPEARGQGAGSIMTLMPLHAARKMGYRAGVLQSSEMGFNVYRRLGFQKLTQVDHFQWQAQSPSE